MARDAAQASSFMSTRHHVAIGWFPCIKASMHTLRLQSNAFEFKPVGQPAKPATGPFSTRMAPAESQAENAMTPQQNRLEAKTPGTSGTVVSQLRDVKPAEREAEPATPLVWSELLLWTEPLQTLVVFVGGLVAFGLFTWVAYGAHNWSLLSSKLSV